MCLRMQHPKDTTSCVPYSILGHTTQISKDKEMSDTQTEEHSRK